MYWFFFIKCAFFIPRVCEQHFYQKKSQFNQNTIKRTLFYTVLGLVGALTMLFFDISCSFSNNREFAPSFSPLP